LLSVGLLIEQKANTMIRVTMINPYGLRLYASHTVHREHAPVDEGKRAANLRMKIRVSRRINHVEEAPARREGRRGRLHRYTPTPFDGERI